jgi:hypothetical protein
VGGADAHSGAERLGLRWRLGVPGATP